MWHLWSFRYFLLHLIIGQFCVPLGKAMWPSGSSNIELLGLFNDALNTSKSTLVSVHTRAMFKAAVLLSQQYNITVEGQLIGWQTAQTGGDVISALGNSCLAISTSNIVGIVGPNLSREAHIIASFAKTIGIPVISYGATDPDLSDRNIYSTFYRTVPSDKVAAKAFVDLFHRYNWTSCTIIYQNDAFGLGGVKAMGEIFDENNLIIDQMIPFDIMTRNIQGYLRKYLMNSATQIVVVWVEIDYVSLVVQNALDDDLLGPHFLWISSSSIALDSFNETVREKLIGMLTVEPVSGSVIDEKVNKTLLNEAYQIWQKYEPESFPGPTNVNSYGLFAFDAAWSLIQALKEYCSISMNTSCVSNANSSFCFNRHFLHSRPFLDTINKNVFLGVSGLVQFGVNTTNRINGIYYYSQNVQPSTNGLTYVPALVWSDLHSWKVYGRLDLIVWPGKSLKPPSSRAKLEGVSLRILIVTTPPFTVITNGIDQFGSNKTIYTGYFPDLIYLLQREMKFIPEFILKPANLTYTHSIEAVSNGTYDMLVGDVTITAERREIADFSSAISEDALRIIIRKNLHGSVDLLSFLKPFTRNLWLLILVASVYSAILIFVYEREENKALKSKSITSSVAMSGWYSVGTLMGYGVDFQVRTAAGRLLTTSLYILSLILVATYTANLASNLTILKSQNIISGLDDIKNGKIPPHRIGIRVGTTFEVFYLREISDGQQNFYPLRSLKESIDSLLSGTIDVVILGNTVAEYLTKKVYCNLTLVGAPFDFGSFGIVTPKYWIYGEELDVNILSLKESGVLDRLKEKWFFANMCPASFDVSTSMGVDAVSGLFLIFGVISALSCFLFAWKKRTIIRNCLKNRVWRKVLLTKTKFLHSTDQLQNLSNRQDGLKSRSTLQSIFQQDDLPV